jgi:hypothetical protein
VLFEPDISAVKDNRFDIAHLTLQTLVNTCPNSENASVAAVWNSSAACDESVLNDTSHGLSQIV